jgi:hypothetical protein
MRFGLNVRGKFSDGDAWLGMSNCPGEWCVAYHRTHQQYMKSTRESRLPMGESIAYGRGDLLHTGYFNGDWTCMDIARTNARGPEAIPVCLHVPRELPERLPLQRKGCERLLPH